MESCRNLLRQRRGFAASYNRWRRSAPFRVDAEGSYCKDNEQIVYRKPRGVYNRKLIRTQRGVFSIARLTGMAGNFAVIALPISL